MRRMRWSLRALALSICGAAFADDVATARLAALARVWASIKYEHPYLGHRDAPDWDAALISAIPKVRGAQSATAFGDALAGMLARLHDPQTRVVAAERPTDARDAVFGSRMTDDDILVVTLGDSYALWGADAQAALQQVLAAVPRARAVVLDARSARPIDAYGRLEMRQTVARLDRLLTSQTLDTAGERRRVWYGFAGNPSPFASGQYYGGWFTEPGQRIAPAPEGRDVPSVVVVDAYAALPEATLARQRAGLTLVVFDGDPATSDVVTTKGIDVGEGLRVNVRIAEPVFGDGTSARFEPDVVVDGAKEDALERAIAAARSFRRSAFTPVPAPATAAPMRDDAYASMAYPALEYRLLALFRVWNVIDRFAPFRPADWDDVLTQFIPRFASAANAREYAQAIADVAVRMQDSHAYVAGDAYDALAGNGYPPIRVRMIEGEPVVVALFDPEAAAAGVRVGDIVVSVDGEEAHARFARYRGLISASTPQSSLDKAALAFMNGPIGSAVRLRLRGSDGEREARLVRRAEDYTTLYHRERTGDVVRILDGNIGYVDLDRLAAENVDAMFERLRNTRAIVFDMRGYPLDTIWTIAPRLTSARSVAARLQTPMVGHGMQDAAMETVEQRIAPTPPGAWLYTGRTVMLIDERAESQAEHTGLFLRAANGTKFIGSRTAGADGEVNTVKLPGAITVGFTGQAVQFPDGTPVQRAGLVPDIEVLPTLAGIRAGRDEVLERAIEELRSRD